MVIVQYVASVRGGSMWDKSYPNEIKGLRWPKRNKPWHGTCYSYLAWNAQQGRKAKASEGETLANLTR